MEFFRIVDVQTTEKTLQEKLIIHLTINRERKPEEFIEELKLFLEDLEQGLINTSLC